MTLGNGGMGLLCERMDFAAAAFASPLSQD